MASAHPGASIAAQKAFLEEIGYLLPEGPDFTIDTTNVDPEIASVAGPQLVVPVTNARYALNAANARWGSLYDCLYGTDAMGSLPPAGGYERGRGARVVARVRVFLDDAFPVQGTSHADARRYHVKDGALLVDDMPLIHPGKFAGYRGNPKAPDSVLLRNNGLHVELVFDRAHFIGSKDQALLADVVIESALSAIMDCEDSVACVDAEDKVLAYSNWLGLMKGDLEAKLEKGGKTFMRRLNPDREFTAPDGKPLSLKGQALLWVRNVGHLMTTPAILDKGGAEIPEGLMDAVITTTIALHDIQKKQGPRNSRFGSVYVVKPKMHGPEEVAFTDEIFTAVEKLLALPQYTVKIGIMDEERPYLGQPQGMHPGGAPPRRLHQHGLPRPHRRRDPHLDGGGPLQPQGLHQAQGLDHGLRESQRRHRPRMRALRQGADRQGHVGRTRHDGGDAGAEGRSSEVWRQLRLGALAHRRHAARPALPPHRCLRRAEAACRRWPPCPCGGAARHSRRCLPHVERGADPARDREQCARHPGLRVRWIDQGIGCSKVPDINNVGLMEDRATLRISSQHIANWLHHKVCSREQVMEVMKRMAAVVDKQNAGDAAYKPMAPDFALSTAFQTACDLVFKGREQPNGYTEPLLHAARLKVKARN